LAGSNADITAALKTLPGAQQVESRKACFVRGGAGYEAKQYIDGTLVNTPIFSSVPDIAQRGRFSPFLFKGTVFSTGGYSALYGQALSSDGIARIIDLPEKSQATASISPIIVGVVTRSWQRIKDLPGAPARLCERWPVFQGVKQQPDYFPGTPVPQCGRQFQD